VSSSRPPNPDAQPPDPATATAVDQHPPRLTLEQIGYEAADIDTIRHAIHAPDGLVLVVGPTGSGRRTALYSMLEQLDPAQRSIQTVESDVLRPIPRWTQSRLPDQRYRRDGRRWERAIGRALRAGADAILVEKIETAAMARLVMQAARAGHLVLSMMALGRACSVVAEFQRLHVPLAQLLDALSLVIGHRLVARLCTQCSTPDDRESVRRALASALNTWLAGSAVRARRAAPDGCSRCGHRGYDGRLLIYELLDIDTRARSLIASGVDPVEFELALLADGRSLWDRGLKRVADGTTSLDALQAAVRQPR
jgi:type II secretory ATPase GspE/PulE/Tfp pilus assembly ATPase PilB-like protein